MTLFNNAQSITITDDAINITLQVSDEDLARALGVDLSILGALEGANGQAPSLATITPAEMTPDATTTAPPVNKFTREPADLAR